MSIESAAFISGLVIANPPGTDAISEGDNHIRLIKTVLKATLPNGYQAMNGIHTGSEPTSNSTGQLWFDTSDNLLKMRNEADDGWIVLDASEGARVLEVTHKIDSSSNRPATNDVYENTGMTVAPVKISATSNLYIQFTSYINIATNFSTTSSSVITGYLGADDTDPATIIAGTTADLKTIFFDDVGEGSGVTWDATNTFSRTFKVTAANCPDATTGTNTFNWVDKFNDRAQMTASRQATWMVWEVEE
jgi:hypothetical protein